MIYLLLLPIILIALVIISQAWRFASRRYTLPCPVWMKWLLDSPFSGRVNARTQKTIGLIKVKPA